MARHLVGVYLFHVSIPSGDGVVTGDIRHRCPLIEAEMARDLCVPGSRDRKFPCMGLVLSSGIGRTFLCAWTIRGELCCGRGGSRHNLVLGRVG